MAEKKLSVKEEITEALKKTGRENVEGLIKYMDEIGFFTAPASGGNHSNSQGGLAEHSLNVCHIAEKIGVSLLGGENYNKVQNSVVIAALLHDLGKCGDYGKQMYVPNMIKDGKPTKAEPEQKYKQSEAKPWKRNPDLLPLDHATRSIKLATLFIDLTEDEEFAIRYHDGLYETANYGVKGHETQLYMILHWADMWSSRVLEGDTGEGGEE
jgi:23S rRNA maturation-related 3'-5' exoribonuclease YhaM